MSDRVATRVATRAGGPARAVVWRLELGVVSDSVVPPAALVHSSPIPGVRFMTARGWNFPWRKLAGGLEIAWVERGHSEWQVGAYRGTRSAGSVSVIEPSELAVGTRVLAAGDFFQIELDPDRFTLHGALHRQVDARPVTEQAAAVARAVRGNDGELAVESALAELLASLARTPGPLTPPKVAAGLVARMQALVHDRYRDPLSLSELAGEAGISRFKAVRAFRQELGVTPFEYLRHVRLERAAAALRNGERPSEVAVATGFADQAHLSRSFAAMFLMPPGAFARAHALGSRQAQRSRFSPLARPAASAAIASKRSENSSGPTDR